LLLYRVFPYSPSAGSGEAGHPDYVHRPQGAGRLDNPNEYECLYLSAEASGAVGEVFGQLSQWSVDMFTFPAAPGATRALGTYELADEAPVLDLDDAQTLLDRGLRPTQVIERNRPTTQAWALRVFREIDQSRRGARKWDGVRWWSYQRPYWRIYGLWGPRPHCVQVDALDLAHPSVVDAAQALARPIA
jgi:hypothetical protein